MKFDEVMKQLKVDILNLLLGNILIYKRLRGGGGGGVGGGELLFYKLPKKKDSTLACIQIFINGFDSILIW